MRNRNPVVSLIIRFFDFINAVFLGLYGFLILGPLGFLRGPLMLEKAFWYIRVLVPMGLMSRSIRVAIDWRLGHFDIAISQAESLISQVEEFYQIKPESQVRRRVLGDLYTILTRAYMHAGHIDEAMQVVLRAKKCLGIERLVGLVDLDAKTAHLVRAGLAAGRLLDGSGMATMFIKTHTGEHSGDASGARKPDPSSDGYANAANQKSNPEDSDPASGFQGAKVIPFPGCPD